jgi:iron(III) transport system ATP-binding protein
MSAISVTGLRAGYDDRPVLDGLDLAAGSGELVAVLGESGSGKTTLLRALAGFLRPWSGTIAVADRVVAGAGTWVPPERRRIGVVPQEGALFPHLDVLGNVSFGLPRGRGRAERAGRYVDMVGLTGLGSARPHELSGGQQQRVALARALAPEPDVLLLDEPFSALDAALRVRLRVEVRQLLSELGTTTILVTHDQDEALSMADRVVVVRDGRVAQCGTPDELYTRPLDLATARFVGDLVELPGRLSADGTVACALGRLPGDLVAAGAAPTGSDVLVTLRPEPLTVSSAGRTSADGAGGDVVARSFHGHDTLVDVRLDGGVPVRVRVLGECDARPGDRVLVSAHGPVRVYPGDASS